MKNDKIIQIIERQDKKLLGLSDNGNVYQFINNEWVLLKESPDRLKDNLK